MGKHKKPRHRRGRNKEGKRQQQSAEPAASMPPLVARIRHADPNTRLAALTALYSSTTTASFDAPLWQAVCEQVVIRPGCSVAQLSIATMAATILAEWTSSSNSLDAAATAGKTNTAQGQNNLTAGWPLVLQGQLQTCLTVWKDTTAAHRTLWGQCAWQCLYAWTSLVESNPVVMDRFQQQSQQCNAALALLRDWLLATTTTTEAVAAASAAATEEWIDLRHKLAETTARGLHSLLQDNPGVVEPWWDNASSTDTAWLTTLVPKLLASSGHDTTIDATPVTRLHLAGVWMTCRNILSDASALQTPKVVQSVARTLHDSLAVPALQPPLDVWQASFCEATEQTQDDILERLVVRQQSQKHEPAREIARRLAKTKAGGMKLDVDENDDDDGDQDKDAMEEEGTLKPGQLPTKRTDHVQNWQDMFQGWETSLRPLELALEVIAHLTAVAPEDSVRMEDDDGDIAMQSAVWDAILQQHFRELPIHLWNCFQTLHGHECAALPEPMALHWSDLQSKASTGLGHCLVQLARENNGPTILGMARSQLWQALWSAAKQTRIASIGRQSALGAAVVAMQTHTAMRQEVTPAELEFLIGLLQSNDESPAVVREAIVILGILCSQEEHAATVNRSVCAALLGRLDKTDESVVVRAEALNALMDIYGNDDCHPTVFDDLKVLSYFERSLPILEQQISIVDRQAVDSNDFEYWKETALNVSRFIEYKHE